MNRLGISDIEGGSNQDSTEVLSPEGTQDPELIARQAAFRTIFDKERLSRRDRAKILATGVVSPPTLRAMRSIRKHGTVGIPVIPAADGNPVSPNRIAHVSPATFESPEIQSETP